MLIDVDRVSAQEGMKAYRTRDTLLITHPQNVWAHRVQEKPFQEALFRSRTVQYPQPVMDV